MNPENNEPRHGQCVGGRVSGAVAAGTKLPHASDNPRQGRAQTAGKVLAAVRRMILRTYWQAAKKLYQQGNFPDYASAAWMELPIEDPRKQAGLVAFAEMWRKFGDEIADDLNRQLAYPEPLWQRATTEACDIAARQIRARNERSKKEAA